MEQFFQDIPGHESWTEVREVTTSWSNDRKFYLQTEDGKKLLLRLADSFLYEEKKKEFERVKRWNTLSFPMSQALAFDLCAKGSMVYTLLTWVEGESLDRILPQIPAAEQYQLGVRAGEILQSIHSLPVDPSDLPKQDPKALMLQRLSRYEQSDVRVKNDEPVIRYVRDNLIKTSTAMPPVYLHGDYQAANVVRTPQGELGVIGFHRQGCGDRYEEFQKIQAFDVPVSIPFAIGEIHGYFQGEPPLSFWEALSVHVAYASVSTINWAKKYGEEEVARMQRRFSDAYEDYQGYTQIIPRWYREKDGIAF